MTDNARNMEVDVRKAGLEPHIKCFAHMINLATQAGLGVARVTRLLGRVRRVTAFFSPEFNGCSVIDVQAEAATTATTQSNHGRYHAME